MKFYIIFFGLVFLGGCEQPHEAMIRRTTPGFKKTKKDKTDGKFAEVTKDSRKPKGGKISIVTGVSKAPVKEITPWVAPGKKLTLTQLMDLPEEITVPVAGQLNLRVEMKTEKKRWRRIKKLELTLSSKNLKKFPARGRIRSVTIFRKKKIIKKIKVRKSDHQKRKPFDTYIRASITPSFKEKKGVIFAAVEYRMGKKVWFVKTTLK
ncbi:MAG: hypothetical protein JXR95_15065 [Deltaproteobacteria bacterium]|nr:hypothetical protein [Deltaproteobacteria bacterium]